MTNPTLPHVLRTVIEIAAPPERVFEALTDASELAEWFGGDDARTVDSSSDPRPGGTWHVHTVDRDGTERTFGGEYRIVDRPSRLEQTWRAADDAEPSIVRYDLEPIDIDAVDGTRLTVTHTETVALSSLSVLATHVEAIPRSRVRHRLEPAWSFARHRVAWSCRAAGIRKLTNSQAHKQ
jgi:uncharacterized protein YndB with AHSA1/START domain